MPDFKTVVLGAPFEADLAYRGGPKTVVVDAFFDVVVPTLSKADTTLAATVETIYGPCEFRHIEGRLFRPLLDNDGEGWTVGRLEEEPPLVFTLDRKWRFDGAVTTSLLRSPWRPWNEIIADSTRARARKTAPHASPRLAHTCKQQPGTGSASSMDCSLWRRGRRPGWFDSPDAPWCPPFRTTWRNPAWR